MRKITIVIENGKVKLYSHRPVIVEIYNLDGQPLEFIENIKERLLPFQHEILGLPFLIVAKDEKCLGKPQKV